jgi:hypothetical protein
MGEGRRQFATSWQFGARLYELLLSCGWNSYQLTKSLIFPANCSFTHNLLMNGIITVVVYC